MNSTLCIDIGNTSASICVYENGAVLNTHRSPSLEPKISLPEIPKRAVIASVKPPVNESWEALLKDLGVEEILWVDHSIELGISVTYPNPEKIGADRLVNACAAAKLYGTPAVVCDFGTALTFDIIVENDGYIGGVICPGLPLMFDYLAEKTALLPHVKPEKITTAIGKNTVQAMQIGAQLGYRGMVREMLNEISKELNSSDLKVIATGGFAELVFDDWDVDCQIDKELTLKGLGVIADLNFCK